MTEFTRDIKPVNYNSAPKVAAPSGSLGTDLVNAAATGFQLYSQYKNKSREVELEKMVGDLTSFETELSQNGLSKRERLSKVDARVRELGLGASQESHLRTTLAKRRGSYVQRDIISERDSEEAQQEQQLEAEFNSAFSNAPQLFSSYMRDEDGGYSREDKISIVSDFENLRVRSFQREKATLKAEQQLAQGGVKALQGAATASQVITSTLQDVYATTSTGFVQTISNMDFQSTEGRQLAEEVLRQGRSTFRVGRSQIESQYNSYIVGLEEGSAPRKLLEADRDASLLEMDNLIKTLDSTDLKSVQSLATDIDLIQKGLELRGLQSFPMVSMIRTIAPEASKYWIAAMTNAHSEIMEQGVSELASGLMSMDTDAVSVKFGKEMGEYLKTGDTSKASDLVLKTTYQFASDTITNMPARDLSAGEVEKISLGLLGIMQEAATTDDPKQIKEATVLLNSPNFKEFFEQLPENRKAPMGRFISAFNLDVLQDSTDGIFTKMEALRKGSGVTYNADTMEFDYSLKGDVGRQRGETVLKANTRKLIKDANLAIKMINENAKYDPITKDTKKLIDTMIAEKLPKGIPVKGDLSTFTVEDRMQQTTPDEDKIRSNKEILLSLRDAIDNISEGTLVNSPEFKKILEGLDNDA
tara:strand:+ start:18101 stop:20029 length:1929 start_codon:yes stop_codon:yes gene_type:complete